MSKKVSDAPFSSLLGKKVWSFDKSSQGTITSLNTGDRYPSFNIDWDDGGLSYNVFHDTCKVDLVEE